MSVKQRPDGKWRARYRDDDGKEHAAHFATEREGKQWLRREEGKLDNGVWVDPADGRTSYEDWAESYLKSATYKQATTLARDRAVNTPAQPGGRKSRTETRTERRGRVIESAGSTA